MHYLRQPAAAVRLTVGPRTHRFPGMVPADMSGAEPLRLGIYVDAADMLEVKAEALDAQDCVLGTGTGMASVGSWLLGLMNSLLDLIP